jgi:ubiquinone/menaquinone biosynthesis C-methylase UbiE
MDLKTRIQSQFGKQASLYSVSAVHQGGPSLDRVVDMAAPRSSDLALDVATGAGFTACALAPMVGLMIASDITRAMLDETRKLVSGRQLDNVVVQFADAEQLPFRDASFDLVTCRTAPHHFSRPDAFLSETRRVLRPDGRLIVSDTCSPEDEETEAWMHNLEFIRDSTHVRNYRPSEWRRMTEESGLLWTQQDTGLKQAMDFAEWVERSGTEEKTAATLRHIVETASPAARDMFRITSPEGRLLFSWPYIVFRADKP